MVILLVTCAWSSAKRGSVRDTANSAPNTGAAKILPTLAICQSTSATQTTIHDLLRIRQPVRACRLRTPLAASDRGPLAMFPGACGGFRLGDHSPSKTAFYSANDYFNRRSFLLSIGLISDHRLGTIYVPKCATALLDLLAQRPRIPSFSLRGKALGGFVAFQGAQCTKKLDQG